MNPYKTRFFRHYKNKPYRYLGVVRHSETLERMALYETLYENQSGKMWVRPLEMYFENVTVNEKTVPRFAPIPFQIRTFQQMTPALMDQCKMIYKAGFKNDLNETKFLSKIESHKEVLIQFAYEGEGENEKVAGMKIGFRMDRDTFYSWMGAVMPEYQGLGVASELMRAQHQWCQQQGFKKIETRTQAEFKAMIRLNLAEGFEIVGTLRTGRIVKILFEKALS